MVIQPVGNKKGDKYNSVKNCFGGVWKKSHEKDMHIVKWLSQPRN